MVSVTRYTLPIHMRHLSEDMATVTKLSKRQLEHMIRQDEYVANLVLITQQNTPCGDSCKACKCKVKTETFGTTCAHLILKRIVEELV